MTGRGGTSRMLSWLPPAGLPRKLCTQTLISAFGLGFFLPGNVVFFTQYVGLPATLVGLGLGISSAIAILTSVPLARLADHFGTKQIWALCTFIDAVLYLAYPLVKSFPLFLIVVSCLAVSATTGGNARMAYSFNVVPRDQQVSTMAYVRSALNIGLAVGAAGTGLALAQDSNTLLALLPMTTGAVLLASALFTAYLPPESRAGSEGRPRPARANPFKSRALTDWAFVKLAGVNGIVGSFTTILNVTLPLWILEATDAPRSLIAILFLMNTLLVITLQVRAARGAGTLEGAIRLSRRAGILICATCLIALASGIVDGPIAAIVLMTLAYLVLTAGELFFASSDWGLYAKFSPRAMRGEYQAVWQLGGQVRSLVAPALFTWLAISHRPWGWAVIGGMVLGAGLLIRPLAQACKTYDDEPESSSDQVG
ncbi:MFS transporter [Kribbella sp. NPDC056345]|uniref:MFS transporter n=1 Tax=Kribbella sp. NPDC056345 TaxID=3345789 RepID=UPI0035DE5610